MRSLTTDTRGNVLIYITLIMGVLLGVVGLAIDSTRFYISETETQAAADAAAIAAASQLNKSATALTRAADAAMSTPLVSNKQTFGETSVDGTTKIVNIRFLTSIPENDDDPITSAYETTDPVQATYAEVTTETVTHHNDFLPVLGASNSTTLRATSVAGRGVAICRTAPLATCNPNEADSLGGVGADFDIGDWAGTQWIVKQNETTGALVPGNFGYVDDPALGDGSAGAVADLVARADPPNACFGNEVDVATGAKSSVRTAFNTRFDIYENPGFRNEYANPRFRPAHNVTKGRLWTPRPGGEPGAPDCGTFTEPGPPTAMGFPRDSNLIGSGQQIGNGNWDCAAYWSVNHGTTPPPGCSSINPTVTRYQIYRMEIENAIPGIPDNSLVGGENGNPTCYEGGSLGSSTDPDRRILIFAVINCRQHNVQGNVDDIPVLAYIKAFMTEPVGEPTVTGGADFEVPLEVIGVVEAGAGDDILKEIVQVYR